MLTKPIEGLTVADLEQLYTDAESCDKRLFAEMRTNLQLVAGNHYVREGSKYWNRIRDTKELTNEQRIKLTKNHVQRIMELYQWGIESCAPDVAITAHNESELQDQKAAELHSAYWGHVKEICSYEKKREEWVKNFTEIGEVCVKIYWDTNAGNTIGYEAALEEDELGNLKPVVDESTGQYKQDESKPVYGGKPCFDTIHGFNLKRDPDVTSMDESPYLILAKHIAKNALRSIVKDDDIRKKIEQSPAMDFTAFDTNTGRYRATPNQLLVKEIYFRPCSNAPKGFYYIWTPTTIMFKGELPYGIFPILYEGFETQTGNPRGISKIRHIRPCQMELNRAASKVAEHQVSIGDDKVWMPANTKVTQGSMLPGVRVNYYTGMAPTVTPGRNGEQYLGYIEAQIDEMYILANLKEETEDLPPMPDVWANLYRQMRYRKKFAKYGEKFERFLIRIVKTTLALAKNCCQESDLIPAFGRNEYINIPEFKAADDLSYQIKIEARNDDIESQMGKQMVLNHTLQYVGPNLGRDDIGKVLRLSPFLNKEKMFQDFTQNYDNVTNDILALDRGQWRPPRKYDDHKYVLKALTTRMGQPDFEFKSVMVQHLYEMKVQAHDQLLTQQLQQIQQAEAGFIPSGGYAVACDFYTSDPNDPNKTKRVRLPSESINWLIQKLSSQGTYVQQLSSMNGGVMADIGAQLRGGGQPQQLGAPPPGQGMPPMMGQSLQQPQIHPQGFGAPSGQANPVGGMHALQHSGNSGGHVSPWSGAVPRH